MNIAVTVDAKMLNEAMRRAPIVVTAQLNSWIRKQAFKGERVVKQELADNTDTGRLQNSVRTVFGNLQAEIKPTAKYAVNVHEGRRPGARIPPFGERSSLNSWAKRKGIEPFVVARSIARKGIKADPFMDITYRKIKPTAERDGQKVLDDIIRNI